MALETGTYISDLVSTNPLGTDQKSQGDDHIRLLKSTILATFPNIDGAVTTTPAELNVLDGAVVSTADLTKLGSVTASATELNKMDGVTASTSELNKTDGLTSSTAELNFLDGVASAQLFPVYVGAWDSTPNALFEVGDTLSGSLGSTGELRLNGLGFSGTDFVVVAFCSQASGTSREIIEDGSYRTSNRLQLNVANSSGVGTGWERVYVVIWDLN